MKNISIYTLIFCSLSFYGATQEIIYSQDFEDQKIGTELTKGKLKFQGWNKSVWLVQQDDDTNVGISTDQSKVFLVKVFEVIPGATYRWTLDTKAVNNGPAWKRTHTLSVTTGKRNESQQLTKQNISEPKAGKWISSSLEFTVPKNKTEISLQLFRFAGGTTMSIDNYLLTKI